MDLLKIGLDLKMLGGIRELKKAVIVEPVLAFSNFSLAFEVQIDSSDVATGGVLMHEGYPISFESRKLNDT